MTACRNVRNQTGRQYEETSSDARATQPSMTGPLSSEIVGRS
jgi:hypothetical protein